MFENLYWVIGSIFSFLGIDSFLLTLFPVAGQISSLSSYDFFYYTLVIVSVLWLAYSIVSFAIRFVSHIMGVILNA